MIKARHLWQVRNWWGRLQAAWTAVDPSGGSSESIKHRGGNDAGLKVGRENGANDWLEGGSEAPVWGMSAASWGEHTPPVSQLRPMRGSQSGLKETSQSEALTRATTSKFNLYLCFTALGFVCLFVCFCILLLLVRHFILNFIFSLLTKPSGSKLVCRSAEPPRICQLLFCFTSI